MYRIPADLNLSNIVGTFSTQLCIGQFDVQFSLGETHFAVQSDINLFREGVLIGSWSEGKWPSSAFYEVMNVAVASYAIPNDRLIVIHFENGIEMHLVDASDQYESMQISTKGNEFGSWII
jgi:hypothetical protein